MRYNKVPDECFNLPLANRVSFIEKRILNNVSEEDKDYVRDRATKIVSDYAGWDLNALLILANASQKGKFDDLANKLEEYYDDSMQYISFPKRISEQSSSVTYIKNFIDSCYEILDVKPVLK